MKMNSSFFKKSKAVADDFIQSIVFLDDRVYQKQGNEQDIIHDLDAFEITKAFASRKKICAVYDPQTNEDISHFKSIAHKADIIVLDWFIEIDNPDGEEGGDDEADADDQDIKGTYTKDIIKSIVTNASDGLKIILVYTGETDLGGISEEINNLLANSSLNTECCKIDIGKIRILVRAKSNNQEGDDTRFNHSPHLKNKVLKYSQLPDFLLNEFTKLTEGLLSNFALSSLSILRTSTSKILGLYSKHLDYAYLEHKSAIPNSEDAENLLIDLFKDSIGDLLHYKQLNRQISKKIVKDWMTDRIKKVNLSLKKKDGTIYNPDETFERSKELLLNLIYSDEKDVQKKFVNIFTPLSASKKKAEEFVKYLKLNNIDLFINPAEIGSKGDLISDFARLTHHKNVFLPRGAKPILSLGSVVKGNKSQKYFICIQQKCDSVRIGNDEQRKFLFLPLEPTEDENFNFITHDNIKLRLSNKSYGLRTLKFTSTRDGVVEAKKVREKFLFSQIYNKRSDEKFEWVLDLKDLHSQRIVTDYAATLSRVGLDESEWLRRSLG